MTQRHEVLVVGCGGENHQVYLDKKGKVRFPDHRGVSVKAVAASYALMNDVERARHGCLCIAGVLTGVTTTFPDASSGNVPTWVRRVVEGRVAHREERQKPRIPIDWIDPTLAKRPYGSLFLHDAANLALKQATFRTEKTTGHTYDIAPTRGPTLFSGEGKKAKAGVGSGGSGLQKMQQHVHLSLNLKNWAKVGLRKAGVVEEFKRDRTYRYFVLSVDWEKNKNEMRVRVLCQGKGYNLVAKNAMIRRANEDGTWRIHEWNT